MVLWNDGCAETKKAISQTGRRERTEDRKHKGSRTKCLYRLDKTLEKLDEDRGTMKTQNSRKKGHCKAREKEDCVRK